MADGNASTHDVDSVRVEAQFFDTVQYHDTKGLVDLPEIHIRGFEAGFFQGLLAGRHRSCPHRSGVHTGKTDGTNGGQGFDSFFPGCLFGHEDHGSSAGAERRRYPCRDHTIFLKNRLEICHILQGRIFSNRLILVHSQGCSVSLFSLDRKNFILKEAVILGFGSLLVGADPPLIHVFPGKICLGEELFSSHSHVNGVHHVPMLVRRVEKECHVRGDDPLIYHDLPHRYPGHVLHAADHDDVGEILRDFHESHLYTGHG